jgi:hypothetical protein
MVARRIRRVATAAAVVALCVGIAGATPAPATASVAGTERVATARATAAPAATTRTARQIAVALVTRAESGSSTYSRTAFKHWIDANGDCQDTRAEVLVAESQVSPAFTTSRRCTVSRGKWLSWYDGRTWTNPSDVDIDHFIPLKEAWESGARSWSATNRQRFANDLGHGWTLEAVTDNVNSSKGDRDPAQWLPPSSSAHCRYAVRWAAVKYRWRLSVDTAERTKLLTILSGSCGAYPVSLPARAI